MNIISLQITLTLKAPYLIQSATPTEYGVDVPLARNHEGQFYIPATLLIGKLREAWQELSLLGFAKFSPKLEKWLGQSSENGVMPQRKKLILEDLTILEKQLAENKCKTKHYRIRINEKTGSTEKGAYIVTEKPFATGETIQFQGQAHFSAIDKQEQQDFIFCLNKGLQWIMQLGANRTIGFGEVTKVEVESIEKQANSSIKLAKSNRYLLKLRPRAAFCLADTRKSRNLFRSDETIAGGVIKGILAEMFPEELSEFLSKIYISHAFPSKLNNRPYRFPLSLVEVGKRYYDIALQHKPVLFRENNQFIAPKFSIDWKSDSEIKGKFDLPTVKRQSRVRTAIDSEKQRSQDQQLFSYEMITSEDELQWLAHMDLSTISEDKQEVILSKLQNPLLGLGKTKVVVDTEIIPIEQMTVPQLSSHDGLWIITLQTPALLCEPQKELQSAYHDIWAQLSDNLLEMQRFFAIQTLAGGRYLWERFQKESSDYYRPYLLTNVGSVFVLKAKENQEEKAQKCIEKWFDTGIPLAKNILQYYQISSDVENQWKYCPYIPQNGYGEIAVNLPIHWDCRPQADEIKEI